MKYLGCCSSISFHMEIHPTAPQRMLRKWGKSQHEAEQPPKSAGMGTPHEAASPNPQNREATLPLLWHSQYSQYWHTKLGILGCAMGHSPAPADPHNSPTRLFMGFFTVKLLPARPPMPGTLSPQCCDLLL